MHGKTLMIVAVVALIANSIPVANAGDLDSVLQQQYYAGGSATFGGSPASCGLDTSPFNAARACFDVPAGADRVRIEMKDAVTETPGGYLYFFSASGTLLSPQVHFCAPTVTRDLPDAAAEVVIQFWDPLHHENPLCSATVGTLKIVFN